MDAYDILIASLRSYFSAEEESNGNLVSFLMSLCTEHGLNVLLFFGKSA